MSEVKATVFLVGCGRMGRFLKEATDESLDFSATHGYDTSAVSCGDLSIYSDTSLLFPCPTDLIIDFSSPTATMTILPLAAENHIPIVIGTTRLSREDLSKIKYFSDKIPIFYSPNMSMGVNVVGNILKELAVQLLGFQIEISEIHHSEKGVLSTHKVTLSNGKECISVIHEVLSRDLIALGALEAARFLLRQEPGLYSMDDMLGNK